jgi:hypothetical protein
MVLRCKKKTVIEVDYNDLDNFIADAYGLDTFEGTLESPNDSVHDYEVTGKVDEYQQEDIVEAIANKNTEYYMLGPILNDLCSKGKLEAGCYLVRVCW